MNFPFYSTVCSQEVFTYTVLTHPTTGIKYLRDIYKVEPTIKAVTGDADAWLRYCKRAKMLVDFSTSAQTSTIEKR
jgi:hypothetical protein